MLVKEFKYKIMYSTHEGIISPKQPCYISAILLVCVPLPTSVCVNHLLRYILGPTLLSTSTSGKTILPMGVEKEVLHE